MLPLPVPLPVFSMFERVQLDMSDADDRLACAIDQERWDWFLLPHRKSIYCAAGFLSEGVAVPANSPFEPLMTGSLYILVCCFVCSGVW